MSDSFGDFAVVVVVVFAVIGRRWLLCGMKAGSVGRGEGAFMQESQWDVPAVQG